MGRISLFLPFFALSAGGSCLNRLGLLAPIGSLQHFSGGWFVRWHWGQGAKVLDVEGSVFCLERGVISLFMFLLLFHPLVAQVFYSNGKRFSIVELFLGYRLEVQLSLWVLIVRHFSPSHWVLVFLRDVRQFDRFCHFLDKLNWVIILSGVAVLHRVSCLSNVVRCHQTLFEYTLSVTPRSRTVTLYWDRTKIFTIYV